MISMSMAYSKFHEPLLTISTDIAKMKMMKHQGQNIPMQITQKGEKQTTLQQFTTLYQKYYWLIKSEKIEFKAKENS